MSPGTSCDAKGCGALLHDQGYIAKGVAMDVARRKEELLLCEGPKVSVHGCRG